jgi:hypothetical protein
MLWLLKGSYKSLLQIVRGPELGNGCNPFCCKSIFFSRFDTMQTDTLFPTCRKTPWFHIHSTLKKEAVSPSETMTTHRTTERQTQELLLC